MQSEGNSPQRKLVMVGDPIVWPIEFYFSARTGAPTAYPAGVPGRNLSLQDSSLLPPPGEPGEMALEQAAQVSF